MSEKRNNIWFDPPIVEVLYPGDGYYPFNRHFTGPGNLSFYNLQGQLTNQVDPDGVSTLYQYNAKGEAAYTAVDMDQDGLIGFNGPDHITWTTNDFVLDHGVYVQRTRNYVWLDGQSSGTLVSESETSTNGLQSWQINYVSASTALTNQTITSHSGEGSTHSMVRCWD